MTTADIFSRPRASSLVVAAALVGALASPSIARADESPPEPGAPAPAASGDASGTDAAATPVDPRSLLTPVTGPLATPLPQLADPRAQRPSLVDVPPPTRLALSTPPTPSPVVPPRPAGMPTAPPAVEVVEPPATTPAVTTPESPPSSPVPEPPASEPPEAVAPPARAEETPVAVPTQPSAPVEPGAWIPLVQLPSPPVAQSGGTGAETITIVVPAPPPVEEPPPAAPADDVVGDPPSSTALLPSPTIEPAVVPRPDARAPAAPGRVARAPEVASPIPAAVVPTAAVPRFVLEPRRNAVVRTIGESVGGSAARANRGSEPVMPPPDQKREGPGQPFGFSIAVSASGGASPVVTLALVAALLFAVALHFLFSLASHVAAWRQRALPAPLPRPG